MQADAGRPSLHPADDRRLRGQQQLDEPVGFGGQAALDAADPRTRRRPALRPTMSKPAQK